jgi:hypothetical protein
VGISKSTGGGNYQGQVVGISRSSSGDIKAKWWGYQGQGEGLRGQGQKKVVGGACPLQLPLLILQKLLYNTRPLGPLQPCQYYSTRSASSSHKISGSAVKAILTDFYCKILYHSRYTVTTF